MHVRSQRRSGRAGHLCFLNSVFDIQDLLTRGTHEGRILGDDRFSGEALTKSEEEFRPEIRVQDVIGAVCEVYGIWEETLISAGKARPASEARAVAAMFVQDMGNLTLASLGRVLGRKIATLSKSANRAKERASRDKEFRKKIETVRRNIYRHGKA